MKEAGLREGSVDMRRGKDWGKGNNLCVLDGKRQETFSCREACWRVTCREIIDVEGNDSLVDSTLALVEIRVFSQGSAAAAEAQLAWMKTA